MDDIVTREKLIALNPALTILDSVISDNLIIEHNGLNRMDHSKIFIFDETMVISGGMNIGDEYSGGWHTKSGWSGETHPDHWRDYMLKAHGPATNIAKNMVFYQQSFAPQQEPPHEDAIPIKLLKNYRYKRTEEPPPNELLPKIKQITFAIFTLIDTAKESIIIEHAYLMDQRVIDKIKAAAQRGVITTIIRGKSETPSLERANEDFFEQLYDTPNIEILTDTQILHTKLICVDAQYSVVGSANLSRASLNDHEEISFFISGDTPLQKQINERVRLAIQRLREK